MKSIVLFLDNCGPEGPKMKKEEIKLKNGGMKSDEHLSAQRVAYGTISTNSIRNFRFDNIL